MLKRKLLGVQPGSRLSFAIASTVLLLVVLGCVGGSSQTCTGELVIAGTKYNGMSKNEAEAKRNTCAKYCIEGDPQMDAMYRIWYDSLPEKRKRRVREGTNGKWDALYDSEGIKRYIEACEKTCLNEHDIPVKCEG